MDRASLCRHQRPLRWCTAGLEVIADFLHFQPFDAFMLVDILDDPVDQVSSDLVGRNKANAGTIYLSSMNNP